MDLRAEFRVLLWIVFSIALAFLMEPFFQLGDWKWAVICAVSLIGILGTHMPEIRQFLRGRKPNDNMAKVELRAVSGIPSAVITARAVRGWLPRAKRIALYVGFFIFVTVWSTVVWAFEPRVVPFFSLLYAIVGAIAIMGSLLSFLFGRRDWDVMAVLFLGVYVAKLPQMMEILNG